MTRRKHRNHWYRITWFYCPVCARTEEIRERQYSRRPKKREKRFELVEAYDYCNAL